MFKSLKLYLGGVFDLENILSVLVDFGYKRQEKVSEIGDFSLRGGIIDIYPVTFEYPIRIEFDIDKIIKIDSFDIVNGESFWEHQMSIILPLRKNFQRKTVNFGEDVPLDNFVDLNIGEYAVHINYGIGYYRGMKKIDTRDGSQDHLVLEYAAGDRLYVPYKHMNLVQRYIGFEGRRPQLAHLGTKDWIRTKEKTKSGIRRLVVSLLETQAKRQVFSGFSYSADTDWQKEFELSFPYEETPDQAKVSFEVKHDMESATSMDRLICGDVAYGKTEVAMRAAFKAVMDNKQVAFLVPTTILAEQHYQNFSKRLKDFPVNIQMLSRFKTETQQKNIIEALKAGRVDIIVGTHRLLSEDITFKDLGLLIIDEEQRFGVEAKEKLRKVRTTVDVLTLTATPIPRTLYMSLVGVKDTSVINTPPSNRIATLTYVVEYDEGLILQAILRELKRGGQVYFIHNRILDIDKIKERLVRILPASTIVELTHGQLPSRYLEKIMLSFLDGKIDVLVTTAIIESGIDIPNVNTLIVNNAHNFGLADLHQLRGRVGRFNKQAYAYFLIPKGETLTSETKRRLEAIQSHNELGAGFKIAFEDLEIRGAGNLLGTEQHGYIQAIGFDFYCRLLRQTVNSLKKHSS